jgi:hypothetical protein
LKNNTKEQDFGLGRCVTVSCFHGFVYETTEGGGLELGCFILYAVEVTKNSNPLLRKFWEDALLNLAFGFLSLIS